MARKYDIAAVDELPPGSKKIITAGSVEIGIFNVAGTFHALPNLCIHQWGPLCAGTVSGTLSTSPEVDWKYQWVNEGQIVICPWHSLEFDVTTGQCLAYPKVKLRQYPVVVEDGIVKVML
ncbi:MAG TPA: Rieske 2Fe-2S domain-containing protein [Chloroflexota bacterium]|nr:Rieske 2Fe-2S domain-containing protein [Chloroflexota bacterium]